MIVKLPAASFFIRCAWNRQPSFVEFVPVVSPKLRVVASGAEPLLTVRDVEASNGSILARPAFGSSESLSEIKRKASGSEAARSVIVGGEDHAVPKILGPAVRLG
jgi:hypothetical protein